MRAALRSGSRTFRGSIGFEGLGQTWGARRADFAALYGASALGGTALRGLASPGLAEIEKEPSRSTFDDIMAVLGLAADAAPAIITAARGDTRTSASTPDSAVAAAQARYEALQRDLDATNRALLEQQAARLGQEPSREFIPGVSNTVLVLAGVLVVGGVVAAVVTSRK